MPTVVTISNQYLPVSDQENSADQPLSIRAMSDMADNVNLQQRYGNKEIIQQCWVPALHFPVDEPLVATVLQCFNARFVPPGFNKLRFILGHKIGAGSNVTVSIYSSKYHYNGPLAFDATYLGDYSSEWFEASLSTHSFAVGTINTVVNPGFETYITLTATRTDNTSELYLTTLSMFGELS